jgi:hypothetical protein
MSLADTTREQLARPLSAHPVLEFVRCWSKCWLPLEIDLLTVTRSPPPYIDYAETTLVEPNGVQCACVMTGLRLDVEPISAFSGLLIDEPLVPTVMGTTYAPFARARRVSRPTFIEAGAALGFIIQPEDITALRPACAAAVKLEIFGFEVAVGAVGQTKEILKEIR